MRIQASFCLILALGNYAFAQCHAPRYREGRDFSNPKLGVGSVHISIQPRDFTLKKLVCLAQTLKRNHPEWKSASVLIFGSDDSARYFNAAWKIDGLPQDEKWARQLHAVYELDQNGHEERLHILPLGFDTDPSLITTIDLLLGATSRCRLEASGRCLMALDGPTYPNEALRAKALGKVTLVGTITHQGRITCIQVEEAEVNQSKEGKLLVDAAKQNLASWQLEPGKGQNSIRITYSYIIDRFLNQLSKGADFDLPNQIVIRGNPSAVQGRP